MAETTKIQWTDSTFNPWRGCSKVHTGCKNCYAETQAKRNPGTLGLWGPNGTRVLASQAMWREPVKWNAEAAKTGKVHRVFCASLADIFEDWQGPIHDHHGERLYDTISGGIETRPVVLDDLRRRLFALIDATPNLTWQILTKRPENIRKMWPAANLGTRSFGLPVSHRENVQLLYSASDQDSFAAGITNIRKCATLVPVVGLSLEPLVGPIDLGCTCWCCDNTEPGGGICRNCGKSADWRSLKWIIVGGESGYHARECNMAWVLSIVKQCRDAGVPCFVKQLGEKPRHGNLTGWPSHVTAMPNGAQELLGLKDKKGGDDSEWPECLRVRQFPEVTNA